MNKILTTTLIASILLVGAVAPSLLLTQDAEAAMKASGTKLTKTGSKEVCGDRLCSEWEGGREGYEKTKKKAVTAIEEKLEEIERPQMERDTKMHGESTLAKQLEDIQRKIEMGISLSQGEIQTLKKIMAEHEAAQTAKETYEHIPEQVTGKPSLAQHAFQFQKSVTITSSQDPGLGHEQHQLAVILPPSDNVYIGKMTFSASEPVQYVTLHGPLAEGEDMGQPIWTPDGKTKYALTIVNEEQASGGWFFAGNALALHTMNPTPFSATVNVAYAEVPPGIYEKGTVSTGTVTSMQDPGIGHESHQLALILPPRDVPYQGGVLAYAASKNVHLVALHGPLTDDQVLGQPIWTPDGETKYALTLVDGGNMGVWSTFSGNALALHTSTPEPFTASFTIGGLH